ncbi:hypothetical protein C8R47DRAFT_643047 [Mycena vitilis]|nr:hypothetical protein C8R47DRAFT_643047 [Mycena vitilis]
MTRSLLDLVANYILTPRKPGLWIGLRAIFPCPSAESHIHSIRKFRTGRLESARRKLLAVSMTSSPRTTSFSTCFLWSSCTLSWNLRIVGCAQSLCGQYAHVAAARSPDNNASLLCYLLTPPVLQLDGYMNNGEAIHLRISSIEFKTSSHDEGWCSEAGLQGTYAGHSWFETAIMRPSQAPDADAWTTLAEDGAVKLDPKIQYDPALEGPLPGPDGKTRWMVQRNFCAHREFREHFVTWGSRTVPPESDSGAGDGDGPGFVTQLRAGDRVAVVVRAQFPGWTNTVERVEISVSYSLA